MESERRQSITTVYIRREEMNTSLRSETTSTTNGESRKISAQSSAESSVPAKRPKQTSPSESLESSPLPLSTCKCLIDKTSGQELTLSQAMEAGLVDLNRGLFLDPQTGTPMPLTDAANAGLIDASLCATLTQPLGGGGLRDPRTGKGIPTLLEAIQLGLYDVATGRFVDPKTRQPISVQQAIEMGLVLQEQVSTLVGSGIVASGPPSLPQALSLGWVDLRTGQVSVPHMGVRCSLHEAFVSNMVVVNESSTTAAGSGGVALSDALTQGLIDPLRATFFDRSTGQKMKLADAISKKLINSHVVSVFDAVKQRRITLDQAIKFDIVDPVQCRYVDGRTNNICSLQEAAQMQRITKPLTLKDCVDLQIMATDGFIADPCTGSKLSLLEAIECGLLDTDSKSVTNHQTNEPLTLLQALAQGIITPSGSYVNGPKVAAISLIEAANRGYITSVTRKMIFDIDGIKDQRTGEYVSFNVAVQTGLLDVDSASYVSLTSGERMSLEEAGRLKLTQPQIIDVLNKKVGIKDNSGRELSVLEAVRSGYIEHQTGQLMNPKTKRRISLTEAKTKGFITEEGASFYSSLLDITVRSSMVKRIVHRSIRVSPLIAEQVRLNIEEAVRQGLIDEQAETYRDPRTGRVMPLQEAVDLGLFGSVAATSFSPVGPVSPVSKLSETPTCLTPSVNMVPPQGWPLNEAINQKLLDPVTGLFAVPGTDRLASFEECVLMKIINPESATVLDQTAKRRVSLTRALEKKIITSTGHYMEQGKEISLRDAISQKWIVFEGVPEQKVDDSSAASTPTPSEVLIIPVGADFEDIRVAPGIVFSPSTGMVTLEDGEVVDLLTAIKQNKVQAAKVKVKDPATGKELTIVEAIRKGIVSKESGEYKQVTGRKLSMVEAVHTGAVAVTGRPVSEPESVCEEKEKLKKSDWKDLRLKLIDPLTGADVTWEGAIERKILDFDSVLQFAQVLTEESKIQLTAELLSSIIVSDGTSGQQLSGKDGLENGILTENRIAQLIQEQMPVYRLMDTAGIPLRPGEERERRLSLADETRMKITTEPKFSVAIGRARSLSRDSEAGKLLRIRRRVMKPHEAVAQGLIDEPTAATLQSPHIGSASVESLLNAGKIDGNAGAISDIMRGEQVTIKEALERGILDGRSGDLQFPVAACLSITDVLEQGIYDKTSGRFIHPETGNLLSLTEAVECDIVDPLSEVVDSRSGSSIPLTVAMAAGIVDRDSGDVQTPDGPIPFTEALVEKVLYKASNVLKSPLVPLVALTLPVALKRKLIETSTMEMIHPYTRQRVPLEQAVRKNLILAVPYPVAPKCVELIQALKSKQLNADAMTFTDEQSSKVMSVGEALEKGILILKPAHQLNLMRIDESADVSSTETLVASTTLVTKVIVLVDGYSLIGDQVKNERSGRIISLDKARRLGLVDGVDAEQISFCEAVEEGFVNLTNGTFCQPSTGRRMTIIEALEHGLIGLDGSELSGSIQLQPLTGDVTSETLIYDCISQQVMPAATAVDLGLLDATSGQYRDARTGQWMSFSDAVAAGLLTILGIPNGVCAASSSSRTTKGQILFSLQQTQEKQVTQQAIYLSNKTSVQNALREKRIDSEICWVVLETSSGSKRMTLEEALQGNFVSCHTIVLIKNNNEVVVVGRPTHRISPVDILDPDFAIESGFYDPTAESFVDVDTQQPIRVLDAAILGILDAEHIMVNDLRCNTFVRLDEALENLLVDPTTGDMVDAKTGKRVPFYEAVHLGWIEASHSALRAKLPQPVIFKIAVDDGSYDVQSGLITLAPLKKTMSLAKALQLEYVDVDSVIFRNQQSGEDLSLSQAEHAGLMDLKSGTVTVRETGESVEFGQAVRLGILQPKRQPLSLEAAIRKNLYDGKSGRISDPVTQQALTVEEAVKWGVVDGFVSEVTDAKRKKTICLQDALDAKLIDHRGRLKNTAANQWIDLAMALNQGLVSTNLTTVSIFEALEQHLYDPVTGQFANPFTGQQETLPEAIQSGLIDGTSSQVKNSDGTFLTLRQAVNNGLVKGHTVQGDGLDVAINKGLIVPTRRAWSLQEALSHSRYEADTGLFVVSETGEKVTLQTAIQQGHINKTALTVKDPRSGDVLTLTDAIQTGIIDAKSGMAVDPSSGAEMDFYSAMERGLIITAKRKLSVTEAVSKGLFDSQSGKFMPPDGKAKLPTDAAIRGGVIEATSNLVKNYVTGKLLTFQQAVQQGLVDTKMGTVKVSDDGHKVDFQEALDCGLLIEVQRPLFVSEAMIKEVYDGQSGMFIDPCSGQLLTLAEAIECNLIDPESVHVKDTRSGFLRKISLTVAIDLGLVDGETAEYVDLMTGKRYTLDESFAEELIIDSKAPVSIQRMIHQGLYDDVTGKVIDSNNGRQITLHEALRRCVVHPSLPCYFDPASGRPLSFVETCRNGIINRRSGQFRLPQSKLEMSLTLALEREFILDIEHPFSLYDALNIGLFDENQDCFIHPTNGRRLNLDAACKEDLVNPAVSIIKNAKTSRYMKLDEAISLKLVDPFRSVYCVPGSSDELTLLEAMNRKLIVTSKSGLTLEEAVKNGLYSPETGKFVDPSIGDWLDLNQALEHGLIDSTTSALVDLITGNLKSLNSALEDGDIDGVRGRVIEPKSKRSISLEAALERGIIITVDRALTFDQAVRGGAIDLNQCTFVDPRTSRQHTLEEAISMELIDPESAVVKDPRTGRYMALKRAIAEAVIDLKKRAVFDPYTGRLAPLCIIFEQGTVVFHRQPFSFDEAVDKNHLNIQSARFVEPTSGEELNLKQAVTFGCIDSDSALVKDTLRKHFVQLSTAFEQGLIEIDRGFVLNTCNGQQVSLYEALETGLIVTPKRSIPLIESLEYGLYSAVTGQFTDPFSNHDLSMRNAIKCGLIEPNTTLVKDPHSGRIVPLTQAIETQLVDADSGHVIHHGTQKQIDLLEALRQGLLLTAEARVRKVANLIPGLGCGCFAREPLTLPCPSLWLRVRYCQAN